MVKSLELAGRRMGVRNRLIRLNDVKMGGRCEGRECVRAVVVLEENEKKRSAVEERNDGDIRREQ